MAAGTLDLEYRLTQQVLLHCYAVDCVTHFMFSPGGLKSLDSRGDYELMEELSYHQSLQSTLPCVLSLLLDFTSAEPPVNDREPPSLLPPESHPIPPILSLPSASTKDKPIRP